MEGIYTYKLVEKLVDEVEKKNALQRELDRKKEELKKTDKELSKAKEGKRILDGMLTDMKNTHLAFKEYVLDQVFFADIFENMVSNVEEIEEKYPLFFPNWVKDCYEKEELIKFLTYVFELNEEGVEVNEPTNE